MITIHQSLWSFLVGVTVIYGPDDWFFDGDEDEFEYTGDVDADGTPAFDEGEDDETDEWGPDDPTWFTNF
jgi:hypothetical protein